jgi:hypothetical protein
MEFVNYCKRSKILKSLQKTILDKPSHIKRILEMNNQLSIFRREYIRKTRIDKNNLVN